MRTAACHDKSADVGMAGRMLTLLIVSSLTLFFSFFICANAKMIVESDIDSVCDVLSLTTKVNYYT